MFSPRHRFFLLALAALVLFVCGPTPAQWTNQHSSNYIDTIRIRKVTPRTSICIPKNSRFTYTMQVDYELKTLPKARIVIKVSRITPGSLKSVELCPAIVQEVKRGESAFIITTDTISLKTAPKSSPMGDKIRVMAYLKAPNGQVLADAFTMNRLVGAVEIKSDGTPPQGDSFSLVSLVPDPVRQRTLSIAASPINFEVVFNYSQVSVPIGYLDVIFRDALDDQSMWSGVSIPLPKGHGQVRLKSQLAVWPVYVGRKMKIDLVYRIEPLGNSIAGISKGPFTIK